MSEKLVVGNWKMHGSLSKNEALVHELLSLLAGHGSNVALCAPFPYLAQLQNLLRESGVKLGAQDVSEYREGPYTGQVSALMLGEFDCDYVIVGHSERRALLAESDEQVGYKALAALDAGLTPIVCVGETLMERDAGQVQSVLARQLDAIDAAVDSNEAFARIVLAYEPVWAIGTGRTAEPEQIEQVCAFLRERLSHRDPAGKVKVLYGGSVKPDTAAQLFALEGVDGGLIGGASLKARDFSAICRVAAA